MGEGSFSLSLLPSPVRYPPSVSRVPFGYAKIAPGTFRHIILARSRDHQVQILIVDGLFLRMLLGGYFSVTKARGTKDTDTKALHIHARMSTRLIAGRGWGEEGMRDGGKGSRTSFVLYSRYN